MGTLIRLIFTPVGLILVGLAAIGAGGFLYWDGTHATLPERSELTTLTGKVTNATKFSRKKYGATISVRYELDVVTKDKGTIKLKLDDDEITENEAGSLVDEQITALLRGDSHSDIWELSSPRGKVIEYSKTRERKIATLASETQNAPYAAGGGFAAILIGGFWFTRRRRDDA